MCRLRRASLRVSRRDLPRRFCLLCRACRAIANPGVCARAPEDAAAQLSQKACGSAHHDRASQTPVHPKKSGRWYSLWPSIQLQASVPVMHSTTVAVITSVTIDHTLSVSQAGCAMAWAGFEHPIARNTPPSSVEPQSQPPPTSTARPQTMPPECHQRAVRCCEPWSCESLPNHGLREKRMSVLKGNSVAQQPTRMSALTGKSSLSEQAPVARRAPAYGRLYVSTQPCPQAQARR